MAVSSPDVAANQTEYAADFSGVYVLRPTDVISVTVYREADLSLSDVTIGPDGEIAMPLLGAVPAAGQTAEQLAQQIEAGLNARFLRNADVAVNVVNYASHRVTVEGAVQTPGVYSFLPGTRLSGAIAMAEGPTRVAAREEIAVFRETPDGIAIAKFDYGAMQAGTMLDPVLAPGDRVVIGTDGLSQFWQDLLRTLPAFALFTNVNI